ncbi:MAG TPA: hypoxanthine phosphoribosyltransferase [Thermoleophilia bacterium]|nr:hypoxanthine phosphoribosyltransferase [Thermoleophilia bacterium]
MATDGAARKVFLTEQQIAKRVIELAAEISRDYQGRLEEPLLLVSVLKSAVVFLADLARAITVDVELDFMAITSYATEDPGRSSGETRGVRFLKDLDHPIAGRDLLIVEDVIDTGLTLHYITRSLRLREPRSLEICTLLDRPYRRLVDLPLRYQGFTAPDDFFIGYGFDQRGRFRNLPYLAFAEEESG